MKKSAISIVLVSLFSLLNAQTITKSKILGKWKVSAVEMRGKYISVADVASIMRAFDPDGKMSKDEQDLFKSMADMIYSTLGNMSLEFKNNDSVYACIGLTMNGKTETEKEASAYVISNSKLSMFLEGEKRADMDVTMPDPQTLMFNNFDAREGRSLILKKQ